MKKSIFIILFFALVSFLVFAQSAGQTMYVSVKTVDLKSSNGVFAEKKGTLNLGEAVTLIRVSGNWAEVRTNNSATGWVNLTSLSSKRIIGSGASSSAGEIALAGKGFSPETEVEYRKDGLNFSAVDLMEAISISINDLLKFIEDGRLAKGK
jgi:uncharacterized protein YgiM (DUF1202 family)